MTKFRTVEVLGASLPVKIAPGIAAMSPSKWIVEDVSGFDVEIEIVALPATRNSAGRFVCESLKVTQRAGGAPVTSEAIRGVPVARLIRFIAAQSCLSIDNSSGTSIGLSDRRLTKATAEKLRSSGPTDEALEWVARAYRTALVLGESPTKSIESAVGLSRSTAGRWVSLAREKGFLGASEGPGRAGG